MDVSADEFYNTHRGGSGAVILVLEFSGDDEIRGIFGSIESAHNWRNTLGDEYVCVFSPYVVDCPEWGNVKQQ
jgi:hypothetical protein